MLLAGRPMGMAGLNARAEETDQSIFRPSIGKEPLPVALLLAAEVPGTQDIRKQRAAQRLIRGHAPRGILPRQAKLLHADAGNDPCEGKQSESGQLWQQVLPPLRRHITVDKHRPIAELPQPQSAACDMLQLVKQQQNSLTLRRQDGKTAAKDSFSRGIPEVFPQGRAAVAGRDTGRLKVQLHEELLPMHRAVERMLVLRRTVAPCAEDRLRFFYISGEEQQVNVSGAAQLRPGIARGRGAALQDHAGEP